MLQSRIVFRKPHQTDVCRLVRGLRAADLMEMHALELYDARAVIEQCVRDSTLCWAALVEGELGCMFGVAPSDDKGVGTPWMLGTSLVPQHSRSLMRLAPLYIAEMLRAYPRLVNFVHAENDRSIYWLRHMGFKLEPAAPFGPHRAEFCRFEMRAPHGPD